MPGQRSSIHRVLCALGLAIISGCGGGGGGNGTVRPTAFTSWSAVPPNSSVTVEGISQSAENTFEEAGGFPPAQIEVKSTGPFGALEDASATLSFDSNRDLRSLSISTPSASVSWGTARPGNTIVCNAGLCAADKTGASGLAANPYDLGWNYQTFGVWSYDTNQTVSPRTGSIGAMSIGTRTPASALPTKGTADYSGRAAGFYINSAGEPFLTGANMSARAIFDTREIQFSTSNTTLTNLNTGTPSDGAALNLNGTLAIASGTSRFATAPGTSLETANGALTGTATGSFYGPSGQEIGGIYNLKGTGSVEAMTGGFGGKRVP